VKSSDQTSTLVPAAGTNNTGGGGGGSGAFVDNGAAGGSGIVIVRYPSDPVFIVQAQPASGLTINGATLNGVIASTNSAGNADVYFCWGLTDAGTNNFPGTWGGYSLQATNWSLGPTFSTNVTGLLNGSGYVYRCFASNSAGIAWSAPQTFTTVPFMPNFWQNRLKLTFSGYNRSETLTNFPLSVVLSTNLYGFSYAQFTDPTNGGDLRFTGPDMITNLNYEIEKWNTNGSSYIWVQVPFITGSSDYIYAWFTSTNTTPLPCVTNGATWDTNYVGVWHLSTNTTAMTDSSTNRRTSTVSGTINLANGSVDGACRFTPNAYFAAGAPNPPALSTNFTVSAWLNVEANSDAYMPFVSTYNGSSGGFIFALTNIATRGLTFWGNGTWYPSGYQVPTGVWTHVVFAGYGTNAVWYVNGAPYATVGAATGLVSATALTMGGSAVWAHYYAGGVDEVRLSGVGRSSNWVWACWANEMNNSTFLNYQAKTLTVQALPVSGLTTNGATLNGALTSTTNFSAGFADVYFCWGATDAGTNTFPGTWDHYSLQAANAGVGAFSTNLTGLLSGSSYVYRCFASNSAETAWSAPQSFMTVPVTYEWVVPNNGFWGTATNWVQGIVPQSNLTATVLRFGGLGGTGYSATNNLTNAAGFFPLNTLTLTNAGTATPVLSGYPLQFCGDGAGVEQGGSGPFVISNSLNLAANLEFRGTNTGLVTVSSNLTGVGALTKSGPWTLRLTASNNFAGPITVTNGTLRLENAYALSSNSISVYNGALLVTNLSTFVYGASNTANTALIAGSNSIWDMSGSNLTIGAAGGTAGNVLMIDGGGTVTNVGAFAVSTNNSVSFKGGSLSAVSMTVTNGQIFTVGDGVQPSLLRIASGPSVFRNGLMVGYNGTLKAVTAVAAGPAGVTLAIGATLDAGLSGPATLAVSNVLTWNGGATVHCEITDFAGGPGVGWDQVNVSSQAMFVTAGPKFRIRLDSMGAGVANFNPATNYNLRVMSWSNQTGYAADAFTVDTNALNLGGLSDGGWSVTNIGTNLYVHYQANRPMARAQPIGSVGVYNAWLNGILMRGGNAERPSLYFCIGLTNAGTGSTSAWDRVISLGANWDEGQMFSNNVTGLLMGSNYTYTCYAINSGGADWSDTTQSFTTVYPPSVINLGAGITNNVNILRGQITDTGVETPNAWFYYWPVGGATSIVAVGAQTTTFSAPVYQLVPNLNYQYQILASNAAGGVWSAVSNFSCVAHGWYVATNGDNSAGTNWFTAYTNLQTVLNGTRTNDTIYLAGQTFWITTVVAWTNTLAPYLTIRGGYAANTNDPALPGSNAPSLWPTALRGSGTTRILNINGVANGVLDQVTLSNGYAGDSLSYCAGLSILSCANLNIRTCTINGNYSGISGSYSGLGGGVYANASSVTLSNCVIRGNTAHGVGNSSGFGGGIYLNSGTMNCIDSDVSFNLADAGGGGGRGYSGGIYVNGGTIQLKNCRLLGNTVANPAQSGNFYGDLRMVNCTVAGNIYGGIRGTSASLTNCIVWKNQDDIIGGTTLASCDISDGDSYGVNGCINSDPLFEYGVYLAAGSPCINAGTNDASDWGLGSPYTTRTDGSPDSGKVDMGYHYPTGLDPTAYADFYVATNGADTTGTNWTTAFKTITKALAQAGDVRRIYVASGNYTNNAETFPLSIATRCWIELLGSNSATTVINAKSASRVFTLSSVAKAKLANLTITGGSVDGGGGIYMGNCGDVLISACVVTNNAGATTGGGIYASYSTLTVNDSLLVQNTAAPGGNASGYGGGMYLASGITLVSNCVIRGNSSSGANAGAGGYGGGIYQASGTLNLWQSVLTANAAYKNASDTPGGGLYNAGVANLQNCLISTNRATAVVTKGDGIYSTGTLRMQNCTVANNRGEGIRVGGTASVSNSIFWGNGLDIIGVVALAYCDTQQGTNNIDNNCISTNPAFVDNTYFHELSRAGFYTNGYFSGGGWSTNSGMMTNPVIDAGDPNGAWSLEPQPSGHHLNQGAYGNTPVASKTFLEEPAVFTNLTVHSYPPSNVGATYGTLSGEVLNDGGAGNPDTYILWDNRGDQGASDTSAWRHVASLGQMPVWQLFATNLTGLSGQTFYRCYVTNSAGSDWSDLQSFGTAAPPGVTNNGAFPVYRRTATLMGTITDIGGNEPNVWFYYWIAGDAITNTVSLPLTQNGSFNTTVLELQAGSDYQFQILASNSAGLTWSSVSNFTTIASPIAWYVATNGTGIVGTNWSMAFPTVQAALNISENNDTIYLAGHLFSISNTVTWAGKSNLTIRGGFAATNDTTLPGTQNAALWPTALKWVVGTPYHRILAISGVTNSVLKEVTIRDGTVDYAGFVGMGIYADNCRGLTLDSCTITNNQIAGSGSQYGGGLYINNSWLLLTNCLITQNTGGGSANGSGYGGGICLNSGGLTMVLCRVLGNTASGANAGAGNPNGGGLYLAGGTTVIRQSVLSGNVTANSGGGIYNGGTLILQNAVVDHNSSTYGDGIYAGGNVAIVNCTVGDNLGEGIRHGGSGTVGITNTIVWGHSDDLAGFPTDGQVPPTLSNVFYTCIKDGDNNGQQGCMKLDPLFVNTTYYHEQSKGGNYTNGYFSGGGWGISLSNSPAIDAGDASDYTNEPAPRGSAINLGAYGNTPVASLTDTSTVFTLPAVTNLGATMVGHRTVTFNGQVTNTGGENPECWFMYWIAGAASTSSASAGPQSLGLAFAGNIGNLMAGSNYQYYVLASNTAGAVASEIKTFTTHPVPDGLYVATNGNNTAGASWSTAYTNVQTALNISEPGDTVYLAGQTFAASPGFGQTTLWTWQGDSNVLVQGGYAATNDLALPGTNNLVQWPTVLRLSSGSARVLYVLGVTNTTLKGVTIRDGTINTAGEAGLGIYANNCRGLTLDSCTLTNNSVYGTGSQYGGGLFINNSSLVLTNCLITKNISGGSANGYGFGGGIYLNSGGLTMVLCRVMGNTASGANAGAGVPDGGGLYVAGGSTIIRRSVFSGNVSANHGGGIFDAGTLRLENCILDHNSSSDSDGLYAGGNVVVSNCTVANNAGEGIRVGGTVSIANSILWGNGDDLTGTASVAYSDIQTADSFWTIGANGCISDNPLFVDSTYYHFQARASQYMGGYFSGGSWSASLSNDSPCIDAGNPVDAYNLEPAPNGHRINMGAYGNTPVASSKLTPTGTVFTIH